jgi:SAM-dependent methyltransferase
MPDTATLQNMYGPEYQATFYATAEGGGLEESGRVLSWLERLETGTFFDYGCGSGALLQRAREAGWSTVGLELDPEVAERVAAKTGLRIVSKTSDLLNQGILPADVVHLGDVIEHLTDLDQQMPTILQLVKPNGVLLAQGPLEANANLFTLVMRIGRTIRPRQIEMAPYHVLLATASGQRGFFDRFGLAQLEFSVQEVSWPAPGKFSRSVALRPRDCCLYGIRRFSQLVSRLRPESWGNRYFYAGRRRQM